MNILYIADPNSIHDIKWMEYFMIEKHFAVFQIARKQHQKQKQLNNIPILIYISDFSIARFYWNFYTAYRIRSIIKKHNIDVVHILYAEPNALWCNFKKYFRVPMVITCRGTDVLKTIPEAFSKRTLLNYFVSSFYRNAFRKADWVTGTSQRQIDSVSHFSMRKNNMSIVRTGAELHQLFDDTSSFFPLQDEKPFILFPRYIKPIYNHEFCLKAIAKLPKKIKSKYKFVFIGKDGGDAEYQVHLESIMEDMTDIRFEFIEKQCQKSIFELYKQAVLVVMTPISDGSPVSGMEVLLCNTPLILGPLQYDQDIFKYNVIQLSKWDFIELSNIMNKCLNNLGKPTSLSQKTVDKMDLKYNMGKVCQIYYQLSRAIKQ